MLHLISTYPAVAMYIKLIQTYYPVCYVYA
jgi:hypothetical protein